MGLGVAIETGTYKGDSTQKLADSIGRCVTIESSPPLADAASERFKGDARIEVVKGNSGVVLPLVLSKQDKPALFWLDGHYSGGVTAGQGAPCPVMAELEALRSFRHIFDSLVLIDDARLFLSSLSPDCASLEYPSFTFLVDKLKSMDLSVVIVDDVIVGVPVTFESRLSLWLSRSKLMQDRLSPRSMRFATSVSRVGRWMWSWRSLGS